MGTELVVLVAAVLGISGCIFLPMLLPLRHWNMDKTDWLRWVISQVTARRFKVTKRGPGRKVVLWNGSVTVTYCRSVHEGRVVERFGIKPHGVNLNIYLRFGHHPRNCWERENPTIEKVVWNGRPVSLGTLSLSARYELHDLKDLINRDILSRQREEQARQKSVR